MLYVQTDMRDFHFIRISENKTEGKTQGFNLVHYRVKYQDKAFEILDNCIYISEQILYYANNQTAQTTAPTTAPISDMITIDTRKCSSHEK